MVDVGDKDPTRRHAAATAVVVIGEAAAAAIRENRVAKGNVFETARLAGIGAAKKTADLIPLCHTLPLDHVSVDLRLEGPSVEIRTEATALARTGVEMEALTAAAVAALTIYDMLKAIEKAIVIGPVRLEEKTGGKSGTWRRAEPAAGGVAEGAGIDEGAADSIDFKDDEDDALGAFDLEDGDEEEAGDDDEELDALDLEDDFEDGDDDEDEEEEETEGPGAVDLEEGPMDPDTDKDEDEEAPGSSDPK